MIRRLSTAARAPHEIFNRALKNVQRTKAIQSAHFDKAQYLKEESAKKIISTLSFVNRNFDRVLDIGSSYGHLESLLVEKRHPDVNTSITGEESPEEVFAKELDKVRQKLKHITMVDSNKEALEFVEYPKDGDIEITKICCDEETLSHPLLKPNLFNCILSNLSMHWINNLPGFLENTFSLLKEQDSIFIGSMFAQDTLFELRSSLQLAEMERKGGISPHVSPFVTVQDLGNLLNRAGFKMLTIDVDEVVVDYPDLLTLLDELRLMGENNCLYEREPLSKDVVLAAEPIYKKFYGVESEEGLALPATFRIAFFIGWRDTGIQAAKRGLQNVDLKDVL